MERRKHWLWGRAANVVDHGYTCCPNLLECLYWQIAQDTTSLQPSWSRPLAWWLCRNLKYLLNHWRATLHLEGFLTHAGARALDSRQERRFLICFEVKTVRVLSGSMFPSLKGGGQRPHAPPLSKHRPRFWTSSDSSRFAGCRTCWLRVTGSECVHDNLLLQTSLLIIP